LNPFLYLFFLCFSCRYFTIQ